MKQRDRLYASMIGDHLARFRQMAFLTGPRQVGKTTTCRALGDIYLNWDNDDHRGIILKGTAAVAAEAGLQQLSGQPKRVVFDELYKYRFWKQFLKGFFDTYEKDTRILVTGSSRLDVFRRGGGQPDGPRGRASAR
jgi:predicted AAA+ superfamily ATPase